MPDTAALRDEHTTSTGVTRTKFALCEPADFTIPTGQTGANVDPIVLPANSRVIGVHCINADGVAAATTMTAQIAFDNEDSTAMVDLYEQDDPATQWSQGAIPATGSFAFILTHAFRARQIRFILSNVATANVILKIYGLDGVI